jgi:hypothetical protein
MSAPLAACLNIRAEFSALLRVELDHYGIELAAWGDAPAADAPDFRRRVREAAPCALVCALRPPFEGTLDALLAARDEVEVHPTALILLSASKSVLAQLPSTKDVYLVGPPYDLKHLLGLIRGVVWAVLGEDISTVKLRMIPKL